MKKTISLLLILCMAASLVFAIPVFGAGSAGGGGGGTSVGGGVNPGEIVNAPVFVTEFVYDYENKVKLVVDETYDEAISYIGAYDKDDRLVELQEVTFDYNVAYTKFTADNIESYKVFIWEDMVPLCVCEKATEIPWVTMDVCIPLEDIIRFDGDYLQYYVGEERRALRLRAGDDGIGVAYNVVEIGRYTDYVELVDVFAECVDVALTDMYSGSVSLIYDEELGAYNYISIEVSVPAVVDSVEGATVTFKEEVTLNDGRTLTELYFGDGYYVVMKGIEAIEYTELQSGDVLELLMEFEGESGLCYVIGEDRIIEGSVSEMKTSDTSATELAYKINGKWYDVAFGAYNAYSIEFNAEGMFYIDRLGKIAAFKKIRPGEYGYILLSDVTEDLWGDMGASVTVLDADGRIKDYELDRFVLLENMDENILGEFSGDGLEGVSVEDCGYEYVNGELSVDQVSDYQDMSVITRYINNRFVKFTAKDGMINRITFPMQEEGTETELFNRDNTGGMTHNKADGTVSMGWREYAVNDETVVFYMSNPDESVINGAEPTREYCTAMPASTLRDGSFELAHIYDVKDGAAKVVVVFDEDMGEFNSSRSYGYLEDISFTDNLWGESGFQYMIYTEGGEFYQMMSTSVLYIENIDEDLKNAIEGDGVRISTTEVNGAPYITARIRMSEFADTKIAGEIERALRGRFVAYSSLYGDVSRIILPVTAAADNTENVNISASGKALYEDEKLTIGDKEYTLNNKTTVFLINGEGGVLNGNGICEYISEVTTGDMLEGGEYENVEVLNVKNGVPGVLVIYDSVDEVVEEMYGYCLDYVVMEDAFGDRQIEVMWIDENSKIHYSPYASEMKIENISDEFRGTTEDSQWVNFYPLDHVGPDCTCAQIRMDRLLKSGDTYAEYISDSILNTFTKIKLVNGKIETVSFPLLMSDRDVEYIKAMGEGAAEYDEADRTFSIDGQTVEVDSNAKVFYLNSEHGDVASGTPASPDLTVIAVAETLTYGAYNKVAAYTTGSGKAEYILVYDTGIMVSPLSGIAVIESSNIAVVDGDYMNSIGYWQDGELKTAYISPDLMMSSMIPGEIWKFNVYNSTIVAAKRITDYYRDTNSAGYDGGAVFNISEGAEDCVWGPVTDSRVSTDKISCAYKNDFNDIETFRIWNAPVYVVDGNSGRVKVFKGSVADAMYDQDLVDAATLDNMQVVERGTGTPLTAVGEAPLGMMDYVFAVSYDDEVQGVVIYKGGDFGRWRVEEVY